MPLLASHAKMVAPTAVTAPGGVVRVNLEDKIGTSLLRLQLNRDEGGEGGQGRGETHFVVEGAIKALEQGVAARGGPGGHTAMAGQYVSDHVVVKGSRHSNHPNRLKGLPRSPTMNTTASSGPPGHTIGQALLGKAEILFIGREQLHHEVGGDGGDKSGRQGTRWKLEVPEKETGPLIPGVGVADRLEVNEEDQTRSDERRLRNVRDGPPGGQLGGQSG